MSGILLSEFKFDNKSVSLRIGKSLFSENRISLNIENERTSINGEHSIS